MSTRLSLVAPISLAALLVTGLNAQAADGTITFNGEIVAANCTIPTADTSVTLPKISTGAFGAAGTRAGQKAFQLALTCTGQERPAHKKSPYALPEMTARLIPPPACSCWMPPARPRTWGLPSMTPTMPGSKPPTMTARHLSISSQAQARQSFRSPPGTNPPPPPLPPAR